VGGFYGSADGAGVSRERSDDRLVVLIDTCDCQQFSMGVEVPGR